jgi:potassium channel subfamily K
MASAFSICALVIHWRVTIPPGANEATGDGVDDPKWYVPDENRLATPLIQPHRLVGINAAQLVIALISNLFLLLNMARRVRFSVAQPITIVGW